jgi:tetratricopeptide (TPR) repeat protein
MLCELATYVKNHGRYPEALALYEESAAILAQHLNDCPLDYLTMLNNFAIYYIHLKDYGEALRILEKAVDLTFALKKPEASGVIYVSVAVLHPYQVLLHLNLAFLFMEMRELAEADAHLDAAGSMLPLLGERGRARFVDHYVGTCALWDCEAGKFADAESELADAGHADYPVCLRVRAILHRVRGEFAEAERLLRKYQENIRKTGTLHRPEMLKATLEFAECLFGQSKHDEAFAALQEAQSLVAEFALPTDAAWKKTLVTWLQRARDLGKADVVASLEVELQRIPPASEQSIAILEKFRIHKTAAK